MSKRRLRIGKREVPPLVALGAAILASAVFASVFVYYPVNISIRPVAPPVKFAAATNSNGTDLGGNIINVTLGKNQTSAMIEIHPTYQWTYYKDILKITNEDPGSTPYYVYLKVDGINLTVVPGAALWIVVSDGVSTYTAQITGPGLYNISDTLGTLSAGEEWFVSLVTLYPEGEPLVHLGVNATLVYSPSSESPPELPVS